MDKFDETQAFDGVNSDPLERLIEAFVDQSVPEGPEATVQWKLLAAMDAASRCSSPSRLMPWKELGGRRRGVRSVIRLAARPMAGLAAAIAIVAAMALAWRPPSQHEQAANVPPAPRAEDQALLSPESGAASASPSAGDSRELARLLDALDAYINAPRHLRPDRRAIEQMLAAVIRDNPDFARSEPWRQAQERLTVALEKPHVLSMGVGLLGTLSWTTYGRF